MSVNICCPYSLTEFFLDIFVLLLLLFYLYLFKFIYWYNISVTVSYDILGIACIHISVYIRMYYMYDVQSTPLVLGKKPSLLLFIYYTLLLLLIIFLNWLLLLIQLNCGRCY